MHLVTNRIVTALSLTSTITTLVVTTTYAAAGGLRQSPRRKAYTAPQCPFKPGTFSSCDNLPSPCYQEYEDNTLNCCVCESGLCYYDDCGPLPPTAPPTPAPTPIPDCPDDFGTFSTCDDKPHQCYFDFGGGPMLQRCDCTTLPEGNKLCSFDPVGGGRSRRKVTQSSVQEEPVSPPSLAPTQVPDCPEDIGALFSTCDDKPKKCYLDNGGSPELADCYCNPPVAAGSQLCTYLLSGHDRSRRGEQLPEPSLSPTNSPTNSPTISVPGVESPISPPIYYPLEQAPAYYLSIAEEEAAEEAEAEGGQPGYFGNRSRRNVQVPEPSLSPTNGPTISAPTVYSPVSPPVYAPVFFSPVYNDESIVEEEGDEGFRGRREQSTDIIYCPNVPPGVPFGSCIDKPHQCYQGSTGPLVQCGCDDAGCFYSPVYDDVGDRKQRRRTQTNLGLDFSSPIIHDCPTFAEDSFDTCDNKPSQCYMGENGPLVECKCDDSLSQECSYSPVGRREQSTIQNCPPIAQEAFDTCDGKPSQCYAGDNGPLSKCKCDDLYSPPCAYSPVFVDDDDYY